MHKVLLWVPTENEIITVTATQLDNQWMTLTSNRKNEITAMRLIKNPTIKELSVSLEHFLKLKNNS